MSNPTDLKFLVVDDFSTMRRIVRGISRVFRGEKPEPEANKIPVGAAKLEGYAPTE